MAGKPGPDLRVLPFEGGTLSVQVARVYDELLTDRGHDLTDILVLKRFPTGIEEFTQALVAQLDLLGRPNVKTIARHASTVVTEHAPTDRVLSDIERVETLSMVLDGHTWDHDYFADASAHEAFDRDVGRVLLAASYSGGFDLPDPADRGPREELLAELETVREQFHAWLDTQGWIERPDVLSQAISALEDDAVRETIEREFEAILAVGFEEYGTVERAYLTSLAENAELICLGEADASIARVWNEPGSVADLGAAIGADSSDRADQADRRSDDDRPDETDRWSDDDRAIEPEPSVRDRPTTPGAVARYLATGSEEPLAGLEEPIYTIAEDTLYDQLATIANEIGYLRSEHGLTYDDVAVLVKDSNGPIGTTRRVLQRAGIPTASATVTGLSGDRAVRELHALAVYHAAEDRESRERARRILTDRLDGWPQEAIDAVEEAAGVREQLGRWILETDLKGRIAETEPIEARAQFHHVGRLLDIAAFVETADFLPNTWAGFRRMLERTITYVASDTYSTSVDVEENGVVVDAVRILKHEQREAVFLVNVHEGQYPESRQLTQLFPRQWVRGMAGYPGVTTPTADDVQDTFDTAPDPIPTPYDAYYAELARRQLAIGARAASDRLYFCTSRSTESALGRRNHRSRYVTALEAHEDVPVVEVGTDTERGIYTYGAASTAVLGEPWEQLERVQGAASTGSAYDLKQAERSFGAIGQLLDSDDLDPRFEQAVYAQIDRALGEVGRANGAVAERNETETETNGGETR